MTAFDKHKLQLATVKRFAIGGGPSKIDAEKISRKDAKAQREDGTQTFSQQDHKDHKEALNRG